VLPMCFCLALTWGLEGEETTRVPMIGRIEVRVHDVFGNAEPPGSWFHRTADSLHIRTREKVILRELLFSSGEPLREEALAQTERNLRALPFLRQARVQTQPSDGGTVDVVVTTHDAWSTVPRVGLSKVGNRWLWVLGATEANLLGHGKRVEVSRRQDLDRRETHVAFHDPRLAGSRLSLLASLSDRSDGHRQSLTLGKPFESLDAEWGFGLELEGFEQLDPIYAEGERIRELRHVRRRGEIRLARVIRRRETSALRLRVWYQGLEDEVEDELRDFGIFRVGFEAVRHRFLKLAHVHHLGRPEDFNLGAHIEASLGVSTPRLGGEAATVWFASVRGSAGLQLGPEHFLLGEASWRARRREKVLENGRASLGLDYVNKLSSRRVVVASARYRHGTRLDPEQQITMGAESGLRGYPVYQFVGNRSLFLRMEKRLLLAENMAELASFGAGAFLEAGHAWPEGQAVALSDLRADLGLSLIIGKRWMGSSSPAASFDLAYALHPVPGRSRWLFSAGSRVGF